MNWKKNKPIILNLGFLLLLIGILTILFFKPWIREPKIKNYFGDNILGFCVNDICLGQTNNGGWQVVRGDLKAPASADLVTSLLTKLKDIKLDEEISQNKDKFADLDIGVSQVVLEVNGKKLEIGGHNSNYDGTYVRESDKNKVYNSGIILTKTNLGDINYWINKTITNLPILQIKNITINSDNKSKEYLPKDNKWQDQKMVEKVANLTAVKFLNNFSPVEQKKVMIDVQTENDRTRIVLGKNPLDKKTQIYWASTDEFNYYEITHDDFSLLTGKIN
jgi:hypothetical protein